MKTVLVLTTGIILFLIGIIINLLLKIHALRNKSKYVDDANMWHNLAVTDVLTGIYNRNAYNLAMNEKHNKKEKRGIILFDIDNFKSINDKQGHLAGDAVLKYVAKVLSEVFSAPQYRLFRIGGDEFSVLAEGVSEKEIIACLLALQKRLAAESDVTVSKGYAMIKEHQQEAFQYADDMLYADKISKKLRSSAKEKV